MSMDAAFWAERRKLLEADISASHPRNRRRQPATQKLLDAAKARWLAFCGLVYPEDGPDVIIKKATVTDFKVYWEWHLATSKVTHLSTLETSWKYLRIYYSCETGNTMPRETSVEVTAVS